MKVQYYSFTMFGMFGSGSLGGGSNPRELRPESSILHLIANTEMFSASKALMITREVTRDTGTRSTTYCSSPSAKWLRQQVGNVTDDDISKFFDWHLYSLPFVYKLFVEPNEQNDEYEEYFGLDGEFTQEINLIHEQAQEFWSNSGVDDNIQVLSAHGSDLADMSKLIPTLEVMFSNSYDEEHTVLEHASDIQDFISRLPNGYEYPLLTFNAFATDQKGETDTPSTIIIGDGYFQYQQEAGFESEGPEYVLSHEHAHHLQFVLQDSSSGYHHTTTQSTRRQELMADAFSAYFLAHRNGGDMAADEIFSIHEIAYSLGDCQIGNDDLHHGTPSQRRCATSFGASHAYPQEATRAMDLIEFKSRFDDWYEKIDDYQDFCEYAPHTRLVPASSDTPVRINQMMYSLILLQVLHGAVALFR